MPIHKLELMNDEEMIKFPPLDKTKKGLRAVKLFFTPTDWRCMSIFQLLTLIRLWIAGEEERYPREKGFRGRWLLFEEITKEFNKGLKPEEQVSLVWNKGL